MPQSVNGKLDRQDGLVRIGPNALFHRNVFLPVVPSPGGGRITDQRRRVPPDAQAGLPLDVDEK
jgi:hypothetical protein